jgi:hypothetical protein
MKEAAGLPAALRRAVACGFADAGVRAKKPPALGPAVGMGVSGTPCVPADIRLRVAC